MAEKGTSFELESGMSVEDGVLLYRGTPVRDMLAFPLPVACRVMGISRSTLYTILGSGKLRKNAYGCISKEDLLKYLTSPE